MRDARERERCTRMVSCRCSRLTCKFGTAHRQVRACMPRFPHQIFRASKFGRASKGYATTAPSRVPFPVSVLRALSLSSLSANKAWLKILKVFFFRKIERERVCAGVQHADADLCDVVLSTGPGCGGDEDECTLFLCQRHDKLARLHPCSPHTPYATYIYMQSLYYFSLPDSRERKKRPTISPGFIQCHCSRIKSWRSQLAAEREIMRKREKSRPS